ncbi:hypothetical protein RK21_05061 [Pseudomonas plecoglossicida]|nr:hypothetical protein RK21_02031 [Pseudomonas plecoglossicida]AJG16569.1 hypothetical protein RK21_05061 [Pseudomonas plecoglossicida]
MRGHVHQIVLWLLVGPVLLDVTVVLEHLYFTSTSLFLKLTLQACDNVLVTIKAASRKAEIVIALGEQQQDLFTPHHDAASCMSTEYSALLGFQLGVNNFSYELHVVS